jgi:Response regulator receiver domain
VLMHEGFCYSTAGHVCCSNLAGGNERGVREIKNSSRGGQAAEEIAYLTKHLSIAGYAILLARTGAGAIKAIKEHAPDVVLLEIDLSDMDGVDVVRAIREKPSESTNIDHLRLARFRT